MPRQHLPLPHVRVPPKGSGGKTKPHFPLRDRFRCHQQRRNLERHRQSDLPAGAGGAEEAWDGKTAYTNFSKKRARQVTKEDYGYYDYLLCADANNIKNTIRITGPDVDGKIKLLLDFATDPKRKGKSISDPWYSGRFDETYRDVVSGCEGLLAYLKETGQI